MIKPLENIEPYTTSFALDAGFYEMRIACPNAKGCDLVIEISAPATIVFTLPRDREIDIKEKGK